MGKHLVICGHGKGPKGYDPGAVNPRLGITEAEKVREFAFLMRAFSGKAIDYITDQNVYDYRSLASIGRGYDTITELHFNAFNGTAKGSEVLIYGAFSPDSLDQKLLAILSKRFTNRGIKKVNWLYNANVAANHHYNYRLVEIAFIDNDGDMAIFEREKEGLSREFVKAIVGEEPHASSPSSTKAVPDSTSGSHYSIGDSVVLQEIATHYQTGEAIPSWVKGKVYKILQAKDVTQSRSQKSYHLSGINSWVLEQDVKGTSQGHSEQTYTAKKGDNFWRIARNFGLTLEQFLDINGLKKGDILKVGQRLKVHPGLAPIKALSTNLSQQVVACALAKVGQKVTVASNPYGGQCVSLVDKIIQELTDKNLSYTNAIDCLKKARSNGFLVIEDAPGVNPKAGDFYVIKTVDHPYGHIGVCIKDSDGTCIEGVEQNIDGYKDLNHNGINDQLEIGGGGITRRVTRLWRSDGSLFDASGSSKIGKVLGWFRLS